MAAGRAGFALGPRWVTGDPARIQKQIPVEALPRSLQLQLTQDAQNQGKPCTAHGSVPAGTDAQKNQTLVSSGGGVWPVFITGADVLPAD